MEDKGEESMKVLITGGAGYVGTALIPQLLANNHEVTVYDNLMFGGDAIIPFFRSPKFSFINGDIRDKEKIKDAAKDADIIIHLAAIVGFPACRKEPDLAKAVNVDGTQNLIDVTSNEQLIIYGSTGSNYGAVEEICTEETPLNPLSLYGQTKTLAEKMLLENRKTIAWRFATAFGVSARLRLDLLINDFTHKAIKEGYLVVYEKHFMRTFIHVHDMGRVFLFGITNQDNMINNVYNVGNENMNYSKENVCNMIKEKTEAYIHYADIAEDADKRNYVVSYDKITALGYETTITVEEGIDELVRALKAVQFRTPYTNI
ncbi:MAG: NAD-dependent epimerase/dehydratase [Flavobacteriaceae bacterium]|nr:NAD-dependent epimerase/dehydratase [Flavobacteriaceae bacterium]